MLVVDVVKLAAKNLRILDKLLSYLEEEDEDAKQVADDLLHAFNNVENELALDYFPLYEEEVVQTYNGLMYYMDFSYMPVRILDICDLNGKSVPFQLFPQYLITQPGEICMKYTYLPYAYKTYDDEVEQKLYVSEHLLACGIAAEYCTMHGLFESAAIWDKKYKDAIAATYRMKKGKRMPSRGWF